MNSQFGKLNWKDLGKGLLMAILSSVLVALQGVLTTTPIVLNWKAIGTVAIVSCIAYLLKNLFQNTDGEIGKEK